MFPLVVEIPDIQYPLKTSLLEQIELLDAGCSQFPGFTCVESGRNYSGGEEAQVDLVGDR